VCQPTAPQLAQETQLLKDSLAQMEEAGLTRAIPWVITEYGYSPFGGRAEIDIEGALLNADSVATFLTLGGEQTFLYGYEPNEIIHEVACSSGNNMLFQLAADGNISYRMPTYYGARLLTRSGRRPEMVCTNYISHRGRNCDASQKPGSVCRASTRQLMGPDGAQ